MSRPRTRIVRVIRSRSLVGAGRSPTNLHVRTMTAAQTPRSWSASFRVIPPDAIHDDETAAKRITPRSLTKDNPKNDGTKEAQRLAVKSITIDAAKSTAQAAECASRPLTGVP